jgi:CRISPR/Cas system-associated endonuclease Cas1
MEKNSLTFDMPEPLGFFIDFAVIQLIQPGKMEKKDFIKKNQCSAAACVEG